MFKQILVIVLLITGVWLFRRLRQRLFDNSPARPRSAPSYHETVRCAHCGTHVPRSEAVLDEGQGCYCCESHRLARQAELKKGRI